MAPNKGTMAWASPEQGRRACLSAGLWKEVSRAQHCRGREARGTQPRPDWEHLRFGGGLWVVSAVHWEATERFKGSDYVCVLKIFYSGY